jgi:hypothetical protein
MADETNANIGEPVSRLAGEPGTSNFRLTGNPAYRLTKLSVNRSVDRSACRSERHPDRTTDKPIDRLTSCLVSLPPSHNPKK